MVPLNGIKLNGTIAFRYYFTFFFTIISFSICFAQPTGIDVDKMKSKRQAERQYNEAVNLINAGDYYGALNRLDKVNNFEPGYTKAYIERGKIFYKKERYTDAEAEFQKAIDLEASNGEARFLMAYTRFTRDTALATVEDFSSAIEKGYEFPEAYYYRGLKYLIDSNAEKAIIDFSVALEKDKTYSKAYHDRGSAKIMLSDLQGAIHDYRLSVTYQPELITGYINMGVAKKQIGDYQGAEADFTSALAIDSTNFMALNNRGGARYILANYEEARSDFEKAYEIMPESAEVMNNLGSVLSKQGEHEKAIEFYTAVIDTKTLYPETLINRGLTYEMMGLLDEACADWNKANELGIEEAQKYLKECVE